MSTNPKNKSQDQSYEPAYAPGGGAAGNAVQTAMHRVALAQHRAALAGQQTALAALHAELVVLHAAVSAQAQHSGSVRDRVFAVLRDLGAEGEITTNATVTGLNLANDTVRHALNTEFFPGQNAGLSEEQVQDDTSVGTLILEIHDLLGQ
jgi:hypothetical protein